MKFIKFLESDLGRLLFIILVTIISAGLMLPYILYWCFKNGFKNWRNWTNELT